MSRRMISSMILVAALAAALLGGGCVSKMTATEKNPNPAGSGTLVESPKVWNGKSVTFAGEAIGESMVRGDYAWVHINDDAYYKKNVEEGSGLGGYNSGMAVWLPAGEAAKIKDFGDYKHEGDVVRVAGVFNAACAEHGGDMDIHATALEVITVGHHAQDPVKPGKLAVAIGMALFAAALYVANRKWSSWTGGLQGS